MFLGYFIISTHAREQYLERAHYLRYKDVDKCIRRDLQTMNIKRIIHLDNEIHVYTHGFKEFILSRRPNGKLILHTFIARNDKDTKRRIRVIEARKNEAKAHA